MMLSIVLVGCYVLKAATVDRAGPPKSQRMLAVSSLA
jgi:hypothetical protein